MSSGIDSSSSLIILKNLGYEVIGVSFFLPIWTPNKNQTKEIYQKKKEDFLKLKKWVKDLGFKHYLFDLRKDFEKIVVNYFLKSYQKGLTPNPCVYCNYYFKFHYLLKLAQKFKTDFIATGHYARILYDSKNKKYLLLKAKDKQKDQSYYLCFLNQKILKKTIFPVGNYTKKEIYKLAHLYNWPFKAEYRESQDFCYLSFASVNDFLSSKLKSQKGLIIDKETKEKLGYHNGFFLFTLGQRKGLYLNQGPYYVLEIDPFKNIIYVTKNRKLLLKKEITLSPYRLITGEKIKNPILAEVKIRSQQKSIKSQISPYKKGLKITALKNNFFAPTPGQIAVFYQKDLVLGGGIINKI